MRHMSHMPGNLQCSDSCNMMLWLQVASTWTIVQEQDLWMRGQGFLPMTSTCWSWCVPVLKVTGLVWLQRCGKAGVKGCGPLSHLIILMFFSVSACGVYMCLLQLLQTDHTVGAYTDVANQGRTAKDMWMLLSMCSPIQVHCVRCFLLCCHWWHQKSAPCHHSRWCMKLNETKDVIQSSVWCS